MIKFYSQIVNWNNENSGFPSKIEIEKWEKNACGIACLRMIINSFQNEKSLLSYWDLLQLALSHNAYCEKGWIHAKLLEILKEFGFDGICHRGKNANNLSTILNHGSIAIASVTKCFLGGELNESNQIMQKGGHLVVAYDATYSNTELISIICNHPSSKEEWNLAGWNVPKNKWDLSFSGNFIEIFTS